MGTTTTDMVTTFVSSTGSFIQDSFPVLILLFGLFITVMVIGLIIKSSKAGINRATRI